MSKRTIADRVPYKWRWFHWLYAKLNSYFWLPCSLCGKNYGGHEWGDVSLSTGNYQGRGVCPKCVDQAKALNRQRYESCRRCHGEGSYPVVENHRMFYQPCFDHQPMTEEQKVRDGDAWKHFPLVARIYAEETGDD